MRVWTDLCKRKCSYAAGNNFMQVWTDLCNRKCSHAAGNNFMRVWTNLCDRKLLCNWERLYTSLDRSVREETLSHHWKRFYANMDGSVRQEMVLCSWNQIYATDCWQELHFEFSRQNLNWNVQSPSMWWWLITQPRPIWKKAPPGLQRQKNHTAHHPKVLVLSKSNISTPWTHPTMPLGPGAWLRVIYYKLIDLIEQSKAAQNYRIASNFQFEFVVKQGKKVCKVTAVRCYCFNKKCTKIFVYNASHEEVKEL